MSSAQHAFQGRTHQAPLRLVRRRSRKLIRRTSTHRVAPLAVLAVILTGAIVFGILLEQVVLAQSAFRLESLTQEVQKAQATNGELLLRVARLGSPDRVERYARSRLGMVDPASVEYIIADVHTAKGSALADSAPVADSAPTGPAVAGPVPGATP
jgi:cell division protein FtsL